MQSLETIALRRRSLSLTQSQLAHLSGVSQSYIAKLEAGNIEPSYSRVQAIFEALFELEQGRETKAGEIMTENVLSVNPEDSVQEAVIDLVMGGKQNNSLREKLVSTVMGDPFPLVGEDAPVSLVASMLKIYPAVLVQRKGKIIGIITKADLLKNLL